jgi:uncharacterized protein
MSAQHEAVTLPRLGVGMKWGLRVPLRDGLTLGATAYLPQCQGQPSACVLTMTPYISDTYHERGMFFASRGLPFLIVDVRGRGNSEGVFQPLLQEAPDVHDVVEWLARQPFCNGRVGMWGGSYSGYCQWAAAKMLPPHLGTIVPVAAPYLGVDFPMRSNIFFPYVMQWITWISGRALQTQIFADDTFWSALFCRWHESGRPFRDLDQLVGNPSPLFQEWLSHPEPDEYWDAYNPTADQYAQLKMPVLTITGSYDDDQLGALAHYREHQRRASAEVGASHYLIIGPWDHAGTRTPRREFGGLNFGPASALDLPRLHLEWYRWCLQDGPKPEFLRKRVAYYVMGAERWRYADSLDHVTSSQQIFFLDSAGCANNLSRPGVLRGVPGTNPPDAYTYDPRFSLGPEVKAEEQTAHDSMVDQRLTLALDGRQLIYESCAFIEDIEISGFFEFSAWISIDCPDTDLFVGVFEVDPVGNCIRLTADATRARYRTCLRQQALIQSESPLLYEFRRFTFVSREVKRGHRLRLILAPMGRAMQTPFAQKNYNSGGAVADECAETARAVTVKLYHDATYPSVLRVPLGRDALSNDALAPSDYFRGS